MGLPMTELLVGDRVRTPLGLEGVVMGFHEFHKLHPARARVLLDGESHVNFYPPYLLTRIGDEDVDDRESAGDDPV